MENAPNNTEIPPFYLMINNLITLNQSLEQK